MIIAFILLIVSSQSKWGTPVKVIENAVLAETIYTDEVDISHIINCDMRDFNLYYKRLYTNMSLSSEVKLDGLCRTAPTIASTDNGKNLYVTYTRLRSNSSKYMDVFYIESHNGGKSWTKPIAVPRQNMNDETHRFLPIVLVTENKKVWIFYRKSKYMSPGENMAPLSKSDGVMNYITKSKGSSVFQNEVSTNVTVQFVNVAYTKNNGKSVISIIYGDGLYIYYTDNNGVSWNGPKALKACDGYQTGMLILSPFASPFGTQNIYVPCFSNRENYYAIDITSDLGKTWRRVSTGENKIGMSFFSFSKDAMGNEILSFGGLYTLSYMKASDTKITILKKPSSEGMGYGGSAKEKSTKFVFWYYAGSIYAIENDMKD